MKSINLFNEIQEFDDKKITGHFKKWRKTHCYRLSNSKEYNCKHCIRIHSYEYHGKYYHKCLLQGISRSEASDIRLRNICNEFEKNNKYKKGARNMNNLCLDCVNRNNKKFCKAGKKHAAKFKSCKQYAHGMPTNRLFEKHLKSYERHPVIKEMRAYQAEMQKYF